MDTSAAAEKPERKTAYENARPRKSLEVRTGAIARVLDDRQVANGMRQVHANQR
jgi:hypothetical protein